MRKGVAVFFAVACGYSWLIGLVVFLVQPSLIARTALLALYMLGPALGAVAAQRVRGEKVFAPLGVRLSPNRWFVVAWLAPLAYSIASGIVSLAFPSVTLSLDFSGMLERLAPGLTPAQLEQATAQLSSMPPPALFAIFVVQALIAGVSINALFAFGEELGWRGFLFARQVPPVLVGVAWGLWHAPIILQGHNYPAHPVAGVAMMTLWCALLAPPFAYVRDRSGSVWAAAVMHGTLNASAGLALLFVKGGSDLVVGVTGAAGMLVLVPVNIAIVAAHRRQARR